MLGRSMWVGQERRNWQQICSVDKINPIVRDLQEKSDELRRRDQRANAG